MEFTDESCYDAGGRVFSLLQRAKESINMMSTIEEIVKTLTRDGVQKDKLLEEANQNNQTLNNECKSLKCASEKLKLGKEETEKLLEKARLKIQTLEAELTAAKQEGKTEINKLSSELSKSQQLVSERDNQILEIQKKNEDEQKALWLKVEVCTQENVNLKSSLETVISEKEDLEENLVIVCNENVEYNSQLSASNQQIERKTVFESELQSILDVVQKLNSDLERKLEAAKTAKIDAENELQNLKDECMKCNQLLMRFTESFDPNFKFSISNKNFQEENNLLQNLQTFAQLFSKKLEYQGAFFFSMSRKFSCAVPVAKNVTSASDTICSTPPWLTPYVNSSLTDTGYRSMVTNGMTRYQFSYEPSSSEGQQNNHNDDEISGNETSEMDCESSDETISTKNSHNSTVTSPTNLKLNLKLRTPKHWQIVNAASTSQALAGYSGNVIDKNLEEDESPELYCTYKRRNKICREKFQALEAFNLHCITVHKKRSSAIRCKRCSKLFSNKSLFDKHLDLTSSTCCGR